MSVETVDCAIAGVVDVGELEELVKPPGVLVGAVGVEKEKV